MTAIDLDPTTIARFGRDPGWARGSVWPLKLLIRGGAELDGYVRRRCAKAVLDVDEQAAALADALADGTVDMAQFRAALDRGVPADAPAALRDFFATVEAPPAWLDPDTLARGARVCLRGGRTAMDVLSTGSLMNGYRSSATTRQLVATGRLVGDGTGRRVAETVRWWYECMLPGGLDRDGRGWQLTVHVRLMHALVNRHLAASEGWDPREWGSPINQADQAATLALFSTTFLLQIRMLGRVVPPADGRDVMHLWRYVGWLMGVRDEWLPTDENTGRRYFYQLARFAPGPDADSRVLADALQRYWGAMNYRRLQGTTRRLNRSRLLGVQTYFSGRSGVRELGLPPTMPWYVPAAVAVNVVTSAAAAVSVRAERLEYESGRRYVRDWLARNEAR